MGQGDVDVIVFAELSRLGRSVGQIARLVKECTEQDVALHFIKENLALNNGHRDMSAKVILTMFSLLAEIERDLISERTKDALAACKARGVRLGRKPGVSKLDKDEAYIRERLQMGVSQNRIARDVGCTPVHLCNWLKRKKAQWKAEGTDVQETVEEVQAL